MDLDGRAACGLARGQCAHPVPRNALCLISVRGRALAVGLLLWFARDVRKSEQVRMTTKLLCRFGITRTTGYRALQALESAGLVTVDRKLGRAPRVTIICDEVCGKAK